MIDIGEIPEYLHLKPEGPLPPLNGTTPFKAVVVIDSEVSPEWQAKVSNWLVQSGCRYMMAWGLDCSSWDDSVDLANLEMFDFGEIPDDGFVMTTWHEKDSIHEAFWFAGHCAAHSSLVLEKTYIVHIGLEGRPADLLDAFRIAQTAR